CPGMSNVHVVDVQPGPALSISGGPAYFDGASEPGGVSGAHTAACIMDFFGFVTIPPGSDQTIVRVTFQGSSAGTTDLCFCDTLGSPPLSTVYLTASGSTVVPFEMCGTLTVVSSCPAVSDLACTFDAASQAVNLTWVNPIGYSFHQVYRNGTLIGSISGDDSSFVDDSPTASNTYVVESICSPSDSPTAQCAIELASAGDANGDGNVDIGDAIAILNYLIGAGPPPTLFACP
ncbi:MAG: hypothetical protein KDC38_16300, partial [Planctomycetes bacterium]|nr:hypothetical protein [Planctomycetota bacterium]